MNQLERTLAFLKRALRIESPSKAFFTGKDVRTLVQAPAQTPDLDDLDDEGIVDFAAYAKAAREIVSGVDKATLQALAAQFDAYAIEKARKPGESDEEVSTRLDAEIKAELEKAFLQPDTDARADRLDRLEAEVAELRQRVLDLEDYRKHVDEVLAGDDW